MISADDRDRGLIVARYFIKLVFLAVFSVALQAQSTFDELNQSTQQLQIQVALDQSTYFPGEPPWGRFTVTNPTANRPQVIAPFITATGCPLVNNQQDGSYSRQSADRCQSNGLTSFPTTVMAAGEQQQVTMNCYNGMFDSGLPRWESRSAGATWDRWP
jgi:hypothetical protein